jgi:hypothetical protein
MQTTVIAPSAAGFDGAAGFGAGGGSGFAAAAVVGARGGSGFVVVGGEGAVAAGPGGGGAGATGGACVMTGGATGGGAAAPGEGSFAAITGGGATGGGATGGGATGGGARTGGGTAEVGPDATALNAVRAEVNGPAPELEGAACGGDVGTAVVVGCAESSARGGGADVPPPVAA